MHWQQPPVKSSEINFFYKPSMAELAARLVSSPGSFDFGYVNQTGADTQYTLLQHFDDVYNAYPQAREQIDKFVSEIVFSATAKCQFIIGSRNYRKFPTMRVDRISNVIYLRQLSQDYAEYQPEIDIILGRILTSNGQGSKIKAAVEKAPQLTGMFEKNIPYVIDNMDSDVDPVVVARNISNTQASITKEHYNKLESYILVSVLSDNMTVRVRTANSHMSKLGVIDV